MGQSGFTLGGLWKLRKADRDDARLAVATVVEARQRIATELDQVHDELEQFQARRRQATRPGVVRLEWLRGELRREELLRHRRQELIAECQRLDVELDARQVALSTAEAQWRAIDWLREKRCRDSLASQNVEMSPDAFGGS